MKVNSYTSRTYTDKVLKGKTLLERHDRGLGEVYDNETLDRLYGRCSKLILDCVDWNDMRVHHHDVAHVYDILHELYCA